MWDIKRLFLFLFFNKNVLRLCLWGCIGKFRWNKTEAENSVIKYDLHRISVKRHISIELFSCVLWKWKLQCASVVGSNWSYLLFPEYQLTSRRNREQIVYIFCFHGNRLPYPVRSRCLQQAIRTKIKWCLIPNGCGQGRL